MSTSRAHDFIAYPLAFHLVFQCVLDLTLTILLKTLLDDHTPLINKNDLMDFRHRRACLLLLSTAGRPKEIVTLLQNSFFTDSHGGFWIRFHETKTKRNQANRKNFEWVHHASIKEDGVKWFQELLHFAPKEPLCFPREWGGDDLAELRLIGSKYNDKPVRTNGLRNFLKRIQLKLWPEMKKTYFTPHNLRALHLTYRSILGDDDVLLERQAGHSHPDSQKAYTQTMSAEEVAKFGEILKKGVWRKGEPQEDDNDESISLEDITKVSTRFEVTPSKLDEMYNFVEKVIGDIPARFQGKIVESDGELSELAVGGYTHNCNAHVLLNCGHTPGHCRACDYYSPDEGTEDAHIAEIFREMLHYYYCLEAEKDFKATGHRKMVFQKAQDIKDRLDKTERKLWVGRFGMQSSEAKKLHSMLFNKAKTYYRQESQVRPNPSNEEILRYLSIGEAIASGASAVIH